MSDRHDDAAPDTEDDEGIAFADEGDFADAGPAPAAEERSKDREPEEGEPRRRRRRRRGRRRGGDREVAERGGNDRSTGPGERDRPPKARVDDEQAAGDKDDEDDDDFDEVDRPASESLRAVADEEQEPADHGDMDDDDEPVDRDSHRSITTWEDAIGLLIAGNMEARARSPNSGSSSRGRGGRGRGGHGRSGR